jgi:hypothetical protein
VNDDTVTPVAAEGRRERLYTAVSQGCMVHEKVGICTTCERRVDAVLAALAADPGDLPALMAEAMRDAPVAGLTSEDIDRLAAAAMGVRDEHLVYMTARAVYAEGQLSARRDHETRWEAEHAEVERLHSWDGLLELLDEHWPEDIFPTEPDSETRDTGPRIVSLLRWVERLQAELAETVKGHMEYRRQMADRRAEWDALKAAISDAICRMATLRAWAHRELTGDTLHNVLAVMTNVWDILDPDRSIHPALAAPETPGDAERIADERPTGVHAFEQNPAATQVSVCICGKWRDHHVHGADPCGCDACRTSGDAEEATDE